MERKRNKNILFLLPIYRRSESFYGKNFKNIYISRTNRNQVKMVFDGNPEEKIYNYLIGLSYFVSFESFEKGHIFTLEIPEEYKNDIAIYRRGAYSKFSKKLKNTLLAINKKNYYDLGRILFPKDKDRKALGDSLGAKIPNNSEIYDIIDATEYFDTELVRKELGKETKTRIRTTIHEENKRILKERENKMDSIPK